MIAIATPRLTTPAVGSRITVYEMAEAGLELHSTGVFLGRTVDASGAAYWMLYDEGTGNRWPFAEEDIRKWEYDDVVLARGGVA